MARQFDGASEIDCGGASALVPSNLTFALWFYYQSRGSFYAIGGYVTGGQQGAYNIDFDGTHFEGQIGAPGTWHTVTDTLAPSANTWYHLCLTYDGTNVKFYRDGGSVGTPTTAGSMSAPVGSHLALGHYWTNDFTFAAPNGSRMFDTALWSTALGAGEIAALAKGARPNTIRTSSLAGYWPLDGLASPEPDLSGNARNGSLTGTSFGAGPPAALLTPRRPLFLPVTAITTTFKRSFSPIGTRAGSRQRIGWQ